MRLPQSSDASGDYDYLCVPSSCFRDSYRLHNDQRTSCSELRFSAFLEVQRSATKLDVNKSSNTMPLSSSRRSLISRELCSNTGAFRVNVNYDVVVSTVKDAASTVINMACFHTRPGPTNQRITPETGVTSYHHLGTATSSTPMVAVPADN